MAPGVQNTSRNVFSCLGEEMCTSKGVQTLQHFSSEHRKCKLIKVNYSLPFSAGHCLAKNYYLRAEAGGNLQHNLLKSLQCTLITQRGLLFHQQKWSYCLRNSSLLPCCPSLEMLLLNLPTVQALPADFQY